MNQLRLAVRTLTKTPFVTAVAALSLALGIGANAAIFSMFDQILLQPLPVREADRLVNLVSPGPKQGSTSCNQAGSCDAVFSYPMYRDLEAAGAGVQLVGHREISTNIAYEGQTLSGSTMLVSGSYFPVLGLRPALGRLLDPSDDVTIGAHPVAVLSWEYWQSRLGGEPDVLNRSLVVNGQSLTIVGVAPRGFNGTTLGTRPRVFAPLGMRAVFEPRSGGMENRRNYWVYVFGRLAPGVSLERGEQSVNAIFQPIVNDVEVPLQEGMSEQTLAQFRAKRIALEDGRRGQSQMHREAGTPLLVLFAVTGTVLLIACANIANLLLARGANRGMEMAVRLSLGAGRRQLLGQLLLESCLLALLGGVASLLVARWTLAGIGTLLPPGAAEGFQLALRPAVLWFTALVAIGTGVLFGLFPALHSTRPDLVSTLRANTGQPSGARSAARFRTGLVIAQIALSTALLIPASLFIRSLVNISRIDPGLRVDDVVRFSVAPRLNGYDAERSRVLFERLEQELAALPGVTAVTSSTVPLLAGSSWQTSVTVQGFEAGPDTDVNSSLNRVGPGYFAALGIPVLAGREFDRADAGDGPKVAVVNEAFVRKFDLGRDAVGKFMGSGRSGELERQIVGIVRDAGYSDIKDPVPPQFFTPHLQENEFGAMHFYARTSLPPTQVLRAVPPLVATLDPNLPVEDLKTMPQQIRENTSLDRMISMLAAAFAGLATLLAAVGLYGVLAYTVAQRTREIGVRMALGAASQRVRGMVLRQVGRMVLIGGTLGVLAALALGRAARSLLFGLEPHDPLSIALAVLLLAAVALGAGYVPARRAARVDPMQALRYE